MSKRNKARVGGERQAVKKSTSSATDSTRTPRTKLSQINYRKQTKKIPKDARNIILIAKENRPPKGG